MAKITPIHPPGRGRSRPCGAVACRPRLRSVLVSDRGAKEPFTKLRPAPWIDVGFEEIAGWGAIRSKDRTGFWIS